MSKKQLRTYIYDRTKSINLMDRFEGRDGGERYDQIVIENRHTVMGNNGQVFTYKLVIERCKPGIATEGDITFTNFKKGYTYNLTEYIKSRITPEVINEYSGKDSIFYFDIPYYLRAQNSSNKCGYGWIWDWSGGVGTSVEGTYYGETSDYVFAGVYIA